MIKITNGVEVYEVTRGAYENSFKNEGFVKLEDIEDKVVEPVKAKKPDVVQEPEVVAEKPVEQPAEKKEEVVELTQKPVSEWTKTELKEFAKANKISLKDKSVEEAKAIIAEFINSTVKE